MISETGNQSTHKNFVEECAARAIQAVTRGHLARIWFDITMIYKDDDSETRNRAWDEDERVYDHPYNP
jgi:hypothetical protein